MQCTPPPNFANRRQSAGAHQAAADDLVSCGLPHQSGQDRSSIGVNGAETFDKPFTSADFPAQHFAYEQSKHEGELGLQALARTSDPKVVIIRTPLVFGLGAPGNFDRLIRGIHRGVPLALGAAHNQRRPIALGNLVHLIETCLDHRAAANQPFMISVGEDISASALLKGAAAALGKPARLIPVPAALLTTAARLLGKPQIAHQLCGSLQVDISENAHLARLGAGRAAVRRPERGDSRVSRAAIDMSLQGLQGSQSGPFGPLRMFPLGRSVRSS